MDAEESLQTKVALEEIASANRLLLSYEDSFTGEQKLPKAVGWIVAQKIANALKVLGH